MLFIEEVSRMSKSGNSDMELLEYINEHFDEIECELNGDEFKEPKKHKRNFCIDCNLEMLIDYEKSTLVCTKCGVFEYYPVHVQSYNHTMRYSRRKCVYKRYDNFKTILDQFFYGGNKVVQDELWKRLGMKYAIEIIFYTTTPYR